ncbi:MAG: hypothetical protein NDF57_05035 [archaeon GBS-70-058]|nr:hypothetical protein [Candidatus Culexarchaeum nevadense]
MSSVTMHVISFSSLLILIFISIGFAQNMQLISLRDAAKVLAYEISHRVAMDLSNLISIASSTGSEHMMMVKGLDIPSNILGKSYTISLTAYGEFYYVEVRIIDWSWLNSSSMIPIQTSSCKVVFELGSGTLNFNSIKIHYSSKILSGVKNFVVWIVKDGEVIKAGLGVMGD